MLTLVTVYFPIAKTANTPMTAFEVNVLFVLQRIDRKSFWALFCTPTPLQPSPPILFYIRGSHKCDFFRKTFTMAVTLSVCSSPLLCCKIIVLKYFRRTSTLRKFFQRKFHITKISRFTVVCVNCIDLIFK